MGRVVSGRERFDFFGRGVHFGDSGEGLLADGAVALDFVPFVDAGVAEFMLTAVYGSFAGDGGEANRAMCSGVFSHMYIYVINFGE